MSDFGRYRVNDGDEKIASTRYTDVRRADGEDASRKYVVKILRLTDVAEAPDFAAGFEPAARFQQEVSTAIPGGFAPIYELGRNADQAWYVTDWYSESLKDRLDRADGLRAKDLRGVMARIVETLLILKRLRQRGHGNLKLTNVFLGGMGGSKLSQCPILLSDPRGDVSGISNSFERDDLRALGEIIVELVTGEELSFQDNGGIRTPHYNTPIPRKNPRTQEDPWAKLGEEEARVWHQWCNDLMDPGAQNDQISLKAFAEFLDVRPKKPRKNFVTPNWLPPIFGALLLVAAIIGLRRPLTGGIKELASLAELLFRRPPPSPTFFLDGGDATITNGATFLLEVKLTNGSTWTVEWWDGRIETTTESIAKRSETFINKEDSILFTNVGVISVRSNGKEAKLPKGKSSQKKLSILPVPRVTNLNSITVTSGQLIPELKLDGNANLFLWDNNNTNIGLGSSGSNYIPTFEAKNVQIRPMEATITVKPFFTNSNLISSGRGSHFTIKVLPIPEVNSIEDQFWDHGKLSDPIHFTSRVENTQFEWGCKDIGFGAKGVGSQIGSILPSNLGEEPVETTVTVTAKANQIQGPSRQFKIIVRPRRAALPPSVLPEVGAFEESVGVELLPINEGDIIHYTIDGTTPTTTSLIYQKGSTISLTNTATLKAVASGNNQRASIPLVRRFEKLGKLKIVGLPPNLNLISGNTTNFSLLIENAKDNSLKISAISLNTNCVLVSTNLVDKQWRLDFRAVQEGNASIKIKADEEGGAIKRATAVADIEVSVGKSLSEYLRYAKVAKTNMQWPQMITNALEALQLDRENEEAKNLKELGEFLRNATDELSRAKGLENANPDEAVRICKAISEALLSGMWSGDSDAQSIRTTVDQMQKEILSRESQKKQQLAKSNVLVSTYNIFLVLVNKPHMLPKGVKASEVKFTSWFCRMFKVDGVVFQGIGENLPVEFNTNPGDNRKKAALNVLKELQGLTAGDNSLDQQLVREIETLVNVYLRLGGS